MSEAKTSAAATSRYKTPLQQVLGCISKTAQWIIAPGPGDDMRRLTIANGPLSFTASKGLTGSLWLDASQKFRVRHDGTEFRISTEGYIYTISESSTLDTELVSWHWHPPARSRPHLHHTNRAYGHLPTGRVSFEAIVRYILEDLEAKPTRKDWQDILLANEALHIKYRSWSADPEIESTF